MKTNLQVLIIGFVWPEPNSSAAGIRMLQLIDVFLKQGWNITFASAATESEHMSDLSLMGIKTEKIKLNSDSFDSFLKQINPSIVLFDRFMIEEQFGWRVALHCPKALRILDTEDLHSLRISRHKAFKEKRIFEIEDLLTEDMSKREIASILRCDLTLMISKVEINILESVFKIDSKLLHYLPIFMDIDQETVPNWKTFTEKKNFIFIGNFLHEPNWNSVQYLKEAIWPLIRKKMPDAIMQIYGAYPSQKVYQLHNEKESFFIMGRAENAQEVFNNGRVLLAPLRFGAGIKGKFLEAMHFGTPSVTTNIGSEGMSENLDWNGFIADDIEDFATHAVHLYNDEHLWNQARENGLEILKMYYQRTTYEKKIIQQILQITDDINSHRKNNFLGALLQHHTLRSTEYMSRWIEEKNKTSF